MDRDDLIFALDIGTRTVIGVVGYMNNGIFKVLAAEILEHRKRAMLDGQIHNIEDVAQVVKEIKDTLEDKVGTTLKGVSVAAAGRSLITKEVHIARNADASLEIDEDLVLSLEMEGIQRAQALIDEEIGVDEEIQYYCVGHSVVNYYLNDYVITSLTGHKGKSVGVDLIATFLPHTVVDSLYSVMNRVGLEVKSLTLEPIAAINAAIPEELRLLNLALVDVGAGTSDIAITRGGSVVAYSMAPVAGDEITEMLCHKYLVDFNTAETIKLSLMDLEEISFKDIIGMEHCVKSSEIKEYIYPAVKNLSDTICDRIMEYNKKAPNAIFLVGGGSQIDRLVELIAENMKLPRERVAIRDRQAIKNIDIELEKFKGPETVTPLGIAITAVEQINRDFFSVTVNGRRIRLFNARKQIAADALIIAGVKPDTLIGKKGEDLSFLLNGELKVIRGDYGNPAEIFINGEASNLQAPLEPGDKIIIKPAVDGKKASIGIEDIKGYYGGKIDILVNEERPINGYRVKDNDKIDVIENENIENEIIYEETAVDNEVELKPMAASEAVEENRNSIAITVNGEEKVIDDGRDKHIFVDVFNYVELDFDLRHPGGNVMLKLNGKKAGFTDEIKDGDSIEIYIEK